MSYTPKQGDIVLVDFDPSIGHEQQGRRPALVVSIDLLSETSPFVWVVPITNGGWQFFSHVPLDSRTRTQGKIFVEQLLNMDYRSRNFRFLEKCPTDILNSVLEIIHEISKF